jgi:hypothetical protein
MDWRILVFYPGLSVTWDNSGTLVSSTNKTDRHDIPEMLLKVALNTINYKNFNDEIVFFLLLNEA